MIQAYIEIVILKIKRKSFGFTISGKFCNSSGLDAVVGDCYAGFYCIEGASTPTPMDDSTGNICPAGSYCVEGSHYHTHCPNGTYTNHTGASYCYDCPPG